MLAACTLIRAASYNVHAANWPSVLKYTRPIVQLVLPRFTACMYVATYTRLTVCHVYSDRTRGELQVAKIKFFCSAPKVFLIHNQSK
jgi:hypothetical protein